MAGLATNLSKIALKRAEPKILCSGIIEPNPLWHLAPHSHIFHEIIVILRGQLLLKAEGRQIVARAGDVLFYRAGLVHEEASARRFPVRTFFLAFDAVDPMSGLPLQFRDNSRRIRQIVSWLVKDERMRQSLEMRRPLFETLLGELRRISGAPVDPWLEAMLAYAQENLEHAITLDDFARYGKMSRFAFIRRFKRLSGRTPMEELRHMRLNRARALLLTTNLPVKAIAPAVGIGDEYQLSKLFCSHFNLSPRDLRKRG
jgi:AraC-like DNA-binding protein